jgi:hypothetical protein
LATGFLERRLVDDIFRMTKTTRYEPDCSNGTHAVSPPTDRWYADRYSRSETRPTVGGFFVSPSTIPNVSGISTSRQSSSPFVIEHQPSEDACHVPTRFQRGALGSDTSEALSDMAGAVTLSYFWAYRSVYLSAGLNDAPMHAFLRSISTKASCGVFREGPKAHRQTSPLDHVLSHSSPKLFFEDRLWRGFLAPSLH